MNKTVVLRAQKVRRYIIEHPGCTLDEIHAAHPGEKLSGAFDVIQRHRLARYEGGGSKGKARWFATAGSLASNRDFPSDTTTGTEWECPNCGTTNDRQNKRCHSCLTPTPDSGGAR